MTRGRPKGIGEGRAKVLALLRALGTDKDGRPVAIRTAELSRRTGIGVNNLPRTMDPLVAAGEVARCKVTQPGRPPTNEYRLGAGLVMPGARPLDARRAGIAHGAPTRPLPVTTPAVPLSTPRRTAAEIAVPVFLAQPAVAQNTGSRPIGLSPTHTSPEAPAVAPATPGPDAGAALKKEPATRTAPARNVLRLSIDQDGRLQIGDDADPAQIVFPPEQTLALGDFLVLTQGVWRP